MTNSTTTPTKTMIDQATFTITCQRTLPASREDVFAAWTTPDQLAQWWDPSGTPLSDCEIDLRPGGAFKFVNKDDAHTRRSSSSTRSAPRACQRHLVTLSIVPTIHARITASRIDDDAKLSDASVRVRVRLPHHRRAVNAHVRAFAAAAPTRGIAAIVRASRVVAISRLFARALEFSLPSPRRAT